MNILARQVLLNFFRRLIFAIRYQKLSPRLNHARITQELHHLTVQAFHLFQGSAVHALLCNNNNITSGPSLMHVTCVAHLLHNCAMRVRAHSKNIDEVIATIKAATIKNKDRKKDFHDAGLPSPLHPVITRWATWLRAALYYIVRTFQLFVPLSTIGQVQAS